MKRADEKELMETSYLNFDEDFSLEHWSHKLHTHNGQPGKGS